MRRGRGRSKKSIYSSKEKFKIREMLKKKYSCNSKIPLPHQFSNAPLLTDEKDPGVYIAPHGISLEFICFCKSLPFCFAFAQSRSSFAILS